MPDGDQALAQTIYLANLYAQKGTCQCDACQLLRQSTEAMIKQVLGRSAPGQGGVDPALVAKVMHDLSGSTEVVT
jgi:hypothetical protein